MRHGIRAQAGFVLLVLITAPGVAEEVLLRARVASPPATVIDDAGELTRVEISSLPGRTSVPVEVDIIITSRFERCLSMPAACDGSERRPPKGCFFGEDHDGDGFTGADDPDCIGVQGYALVLGTDAAFQLRSNVGPDAARGASFVGTVSDDATRPPGLVVPGTLRHVDIIDPAKNGGQEGVVGVCILSLTSHVILPPVGDATVLKIRGDLDVAGLEPGEVSRPARLDLRGPGEGSLASRGAPITSAITVQGNTFATAIRDLEIVARIVDFPPFKRSDANSDGRVDISDVLFILGYLFLGSDAPACLDSADTDDNGRLEITDGLAIFEFLFFGNAVPSTPGPFQCGQDPTADEIPCEAFSSC